MKLQRIAFLTPEMARSGKAPLHVVDTIFSGDGTWDVTIVEDLRLRRSIRKRLARAERRRRRDQWRTSNGKRCDQRGRHRVPVLLAMSFTLGDWRHERMWDTVQR